MRLVVSLVSATLFGLYASAAVAAGTTSPGKTSVAASVENASVGLGFTTAVSATIEKGKAKRILMIDIAMIEKTATGAAITARPMVNGLLVAEPAFQSVVKCESGFYCALTSQYWVDLDAAETANPGQYLNQPLVVDAVVAGSGLTTADVSLRVVMQKK